MNRKHLVAVLFGVMTSSTFVPQSFALDTPTHRQINEYVARADLDEFSLDLYLRDQLGVSQGIGYEVRGVIDHFSSSQTVSEWLGLGGVREDSPWYYTNTRSRHHYHNPLNDEGFSGIGGTGFLSGESVITWSQRPAQTQNPDGYYSWNDVRGYFYEALTASDQVTRESNFAETFRGLGQLMHLVQDMSVPEHTRDDGHYLGAVHLATHYEQWVSNIRNVRIDPEEGILSVSSVVITPFPFDFSKLSNPSPFAPIAPVPVANLFDMNRYLPGASDLPDVSVTKSNSIGLSEYTNANFLSPDTMFGSKFPFPSVNDCILAVDSRNSRLYFSSRGQGEHIDHLAAAGWMGYWRQFFPGDVSYYPVKLDSYCYEEYAQKLLARAVGYSASLLKYFFRGELSVQSFPIYTQDYHAVTGLKLRIRNVTPSEEAMRNGVFTLSCSYESAEGEELFLPSVDYPAIELLHGQEMESDFLFEEDRSVPIERFGSLKCMLAFRGDLGNEIEQIDAFGNVNSFGAVVAKSLVLSKFNEPWDRTLTGNNAWTHTEAGTQPENGETYNGIGSLIKDNQRWAGYTTPRVNESYILFKNVKSPDGLYISPNTRLQFKIDELSINAIPPAPPGMTTNLQALELHFNQGRHFQFSQVGQFMYYNSTTAYATFSLGVPIDVGIYELFSAAGIAVPQPLYLDYINFIQQLLGLEQPSTEKHHQHMKVDYIRIVEPAE
jgi:hypothetical protein